MPDPYSKILLKHTKEIEKISNQRRVWLYASSVVFTCTILLIFGWDYISGLNEKSIWWVIVSLMLIICINWWYWTMRVISQLLTHQETEYIMIRELLNEIIQTKEIIANLKKVDKYK